MVCPRPSHLGLCEEQLGGNHDDLDVENNRAKYEQARQRTVTMLNNFLTAAWKAGKEDSVKNAFGVGGFLGTRGLYERISADESYAAMSLASKAVAWLKRRIYGVPPPPTPPR